MKKFIFLFSILALASYLLSCSHLQSGGTIASRVPSSAMPPPNENDPTYKDLYELISNGLPELSEGPPESIPMLLKLIKNKFPEYLANHTLMYGSLSIHESSFRNPRAIVFGDHANLIITFNGIPTQQSYANLEIMSFTEKDGFEFREILFKRENDAKSLIPDDEFETETPFIKISKANPSTCVACHGSNEIVMPTWENYFNWPGAYGSNDDKVIVHFGEDSMTRGIKLKTNSEKLDFEATGLRDYQDHKDQNSRYVFLPKWPRGEDGSWIRREYQYLPGIFNQPNNILNLNFARSRDDLLFRDIMNKMPNSKQLTDLLVALCEPVTDEPALPSSRLREILTRAEDLKIQFTKDDIAVEDQNFEAIKVFFKGNVERPNKFQYMGAERGDYALAQVLRELSITLSKYSTNSQRLNFYESGAGYNFQHLKLKILREIHRRHAENPNFKDIPDCEAIGAKPYIKGYKDNY